MVHVAETPFIGRVDELQRLDDALAAASDGRPSVIIVGGDAGVGKTRLLRQVAAGVDRDVTVMWGGCMPLGERGLPLAPVVQVLRDLDERGLLPDPVPPALERLMPLSAAASSAQSAGRVRVFQVFDELLELLARDHTALLVIDDLHWADRSTRELLSFITYNLRSQRLLVLGSFRADDLHSEHPLLPQLAEWRRNPNVHRIDLAPFDPLETAEHLADLLGERVDAALVEGILSRTDGNAFFIEELVAARSIDSGPVPESLRELLLVRAASVDPSARRLLRVASAAGGRVDEITLAAVIGWSPEDVGEALRRLVGRRLLGVDGEGYRFHHALMREALHDDLTPLERREIHRAYAQVLGEDPTLAQSGSAAATAELAYHWQEAGDRPRALTAWIDAVAAAESMLAFSEAHADLEHALELWDTVPDADALAGASKVDLLRRAAEDAFLGDSPARAVELARLAIARVDAAAEPMAAGLLHERLARYMWNTSDQYEALEVYRRAAELVPSEPSVERADVLAGLGGHLMVLGRYEEARPITEEALEMARSVGATRAEYIAVDTLGTLVCTQEDVDRGLVLLERALAMAKEAGDSFEQMRALWNIFANTFSAARWEEVLRLFEIIRREFPRLGQAHEVIELQANAADCLMRLGRWDEAEELVADARRRQRPGSEPARLPELDMARGRFDEARSYLDHQRSEKVFVNLEMAGWPCCNLAEIACWEGRPLAARALVDEGLSITADQDESLVIAYLCATGLRAEADIADEARSRRGDADAEEAIRVGSGLLDRARGLLRRPGPHNGWKREVGALVAQCEAEASRLRGAANPDIWADAVAAWERLAVPYQAACNRRHLAEALWVAGDRVAARAELERAYEVAETLGAEPLRTSLARLGRRARIDLGDQSGVPVGMSLTPREFEVLTLVAAGQSNRQIAHALFITEKTASVHVSNILAKLSVASRGEAAAVAHREGLVG
jgi:ATP/maltotriose-dependent transcriptional regulator MalT